MTLNDEGVPSRNQLSLASFSKYCLENPNQRFFQALTNWFGVWKFGSWDGKTFSDFWNLEEGIDYKIKK